MLYIIDIVILFNIASKSGGVLISLLDKLRLLDKQVDTKFIWLFLSTGLKLQFLMIIFDRIIWLFLLIMETK